MFLSWDYPAGVWNISNIKKVRRQMKYIKCRLLTKLLLKLNRIPHLRLFNLLAGNPFLIITTFPFFKYRQIGIQRNDGQIIPFVILSPWHVSCFHLAENFGLPGQLASHPTATFKSPSDNSDTVFSSSHFRHLPSLCSCQRTPVFPPIMLLSLYRIKSRPIKLISLQFFP